METGGSRPRSSTSVSTTSNRPRPISRASTTSIHTPGEPVPQAYQHHAFHPSSMQSQRPPAHMGGFQYTPEEMIRQSEHQLINPPQSYVVDPSLQGHNPASRAMSVDTAFTSNSHDVQRPPIYQSQSFDGKENAAFPTMEEGKPQIGPSQLGGPKKGKGNSSAQANDQELRRLFTENRHQQFSDVATSVLASERGPKAEKTKQVFAMIW